MNAIFEGFLLVTDLDGTLLNTQSQISDANKEAIDYFVAQGGQFTIATGRIVNSAYPFAKALPLTLPAILYNGARVYDYTKEVTLEELYLEENIKNKIRNIKETYPELGIQIFIEDGIHILTPTREDDYLLKKGYPLYQVDEETFKKQWTKILMVGENEEETDRLESLMAREYGLVEVVKSGPYYLELIPSGVSKGEKLKKLIKTYNIDPTKVIAVGDNMNDAHMLQVAAYGFAIKNGAKRLVESAKFVAPDNDNDPIAYIVDYMKQRV